MSQLARMMLYDDEESRDVVSEVAPLSENKYDIEKWLLCITATKNRMNF